MTNWTIEHCSAEPKELEIIGSNLYIQRKNIERVRHPEENGMPAYTDYICESREISFDEYNLLKEIETIDGNKAVDAFCEALIEEGIL